MSRQLWWRLGAASGIAYVLLLLVGNSMGTDSGLGIFLELLGFALFPFFVGVLWAYLRRAEGSEGWLSITVLGAGLVALAVKISSANTILAINASEALGAELEGALTTTNDASFLLMFLPLATMLTATAILAIQWGALPRWLGWAAAVIALALLAGTAGAAFDPLPDWAGGAFMLFLLWTVVTSVVLFRRAVEPVAETDQPPAAHATPAD
jgi:hypothetical protein